MPIITVRILVSVLSLTPLGTTLFSLYPLKLLKTNLSLDELVLVEAIVQ